MAKDDDVKPVLAAVPATQQVRVDVGTRWYDVHKFGGYHMAAMSRRQILYLITFLREDTYATTQFIDNAISAGRRRDGTYVLFNRLYPGYKIAATYAEARATADRLESDVSTGAEMLAAIATGRRL